MVKQDADGNELYAFFLELDTTGNFTRAVQEAPVPAAVQLPGLSRQEPGW